MHGPMHQANPSVPLILIVSEALESMYLLFIFFSFLIRLKGAKARVSR